MIDAIARGLALLGLRKTGGTLTGPLLFSPDNTVDIGAAGANRPRALYLAASAVFGGGLQLGASNYLSWSNGSGLTSTGSGVFSLINNGASNSATVTVGAGNMLTFQGPVKTSSATVSGLPSAATQGAGARAFVTDATTPTFGATVVGGGAVNAPVYSDGAVWKVG